MIIGIAALGIASGAHAQQAVQWKFADGGNGHWYQLADQAFLTQPEAAAFAASRSGALISVTSPDEYAFIANQHFDGCWLGGRRQDANPSNWEWLSGEQWSYATWANDPHYLSEPWLVLISSGRWCCGFGDTGPSLFWAAIEWSADCNGDGIVDYGQCHDGTLPDYNSNNIPDCCERGEACVVGNYPVQWRVEDGGNGHWYQLLASVTPLDWATANGVARSSGGLLACVTSAAEDAFVLSIDPTNLAWSSFGPWLGGFQVDGAAEPAGGWQWVSGEPWAWAEWSANPVGEPNNAGCGDGQENRLHYVACQNDSRHWNDAPESGVSMCCTHVTQVKGAVIEWSADCNSDGIVDYGQILQGQLADLNADGVPDICQQPTCVDADLFRNGVINGADLGILLSQWGPAPAGTVSDINRDGQVNGADLGYLLNAWGPCTN
jgi:hypothetical protein